MYEPTSTIRDLLATGPLVLASIISQSGSAPRTAGARMAVLPDGSIRGTIGGGRYEAEVIREALDLMKIGGGSARSMFFDLDQTEDMDMICGGGILALLEHLEPNERGLALSVQAAQATRQDRPFAFVSLLDFEPDAILSPNSRQPAHSGTITRHLVLRGEHHPSLPDELRVHLDQVWASNTTLLRLVGGSAWLLESFIPPERIHIIGGGHVALALASLAGSLAFSTSVLDDRAEFISEERFPHSRRVLHASLSEKSMDGYFSETGPGSRDAVVIVTRGHAFDREALAAALRTRAGYIGMIGSASKRKQVYDALLRSGFDSGDLRRVHSPIGVPIAAETPEEIAVSIMGELIRWRHGAL